MKVELSRLVQVLLALFPLLSGLALAVDFSTVQLDASYFAYVRDEGDVDGDGDTDIVAVQEGQTTIQVFRAPTLARSTLVSFSGMYCYPRADDICLADMDGDGDLDIVTALGGAPYGDSQRAAICQNDGGSFSVQMVGNTLNYVKDISAADLDGDDRLDIIMRMESQTQVWFANGGGSWTEMVLNHPAHEGMAVGDVNGDSIPDIVLNGFWFQTPAAQARTASNFQQKTIDSAWWGQGGDWTADSCKVAIADVNGDGDNDVVFSHSERPGYAVAWYSRSGSTWTKYAVRVIDYCHNLQAEDFDGDGDVDLLIGGMIQSQHRGLRLMLNGGNGTSWSEQIVQSNGSYNAKVCNMDGDGDCDIVSIRNWDSAPTWLYRNDLPRNLSVKSISDNGDHTVTVVVEGMPLLTYAVQRAETLSSAWVPALTNTLSASGTSADILPSGGATGFLRAKALSE